MQKCYRHSFPRESTCKLSSKPSSIQVLLQLEFLLVRFVLPDSTTSRLALRTPSGWNIRSLVSHRPRSPELFRLTNSDLHVAALVKACDAPDQKIAQCVKINGQIGHDWASSLLYYRKEIRLETCNGVTSRYEYTVVQIMCKSLSS